MQRVAQHLKEHVKYPATRQEILDACAQTKEFTAGEKGLGRRPPAGGDLRLGRGRAQGAGQLTMARDVKSPGYLAHLIAGWIPALEGVQAKLVRGAKVADVGCGAGASTITMAEAFPRSRFFGFDVHALSIEMARERAQQAGGGGSNLLRGGGSHGPIPAAATSWSRTSIAIASTTWLIRPPPPDTCARPSPRRHLDDRGAVRE